MGRDIERESFEPADFERFEDRLRASLRALAGLLERPGFGEGPPTIGAELEMALIDEACRPAGQNAEIRDALGHTDVALEVGRFSIETGTRPVALAGRPFTAIADAMSAGVEGIAAAGLAHGARVAIVGTLPTLTLADLGPGGLTGSARYRALEAGLDALKPTHTIAIQGAEQLEVELPGIVAEAANAAFQVHLRVAPGDFARTFNAAQLAAGPVLAAAGNSPTFLGKVLWDETRVPLFHQAVDGLNGSGATEWRPSRVAFGHGWVREGALELFEESVALHEPLLPLCDEADPEAVAAAGGVPQLGELRLHHGTTWHWNRAVYDPAGGGHLRIEFRALPAGPSIPDMAANAAFLVGLTLALRDEATLPSTIPFACARRNFFAAARDGLDAELLWPEGAAPSPRPHPAHEVVGTLVPRAREALLVAGVDGDEVDRLMTIVGERVELGVTGARWQRRALAAQEERGAMRGRALAAALDAYIDASTSGLPVHRWPDPAGPLAHPVTSSSGGGI